MHNQHIASVVSSISSEAEGKDQDHSTSPPGSYFFHKETAVDSSNLNGGSASCEWGRRITCEYWCPIALGVILLVYKSEADSLIVCWTIEKNWQWSYYVEAFSMCDKQHHRIIYASPGLIVPVGKLNTTHSQSSEPRYTLRTAWRIIISELVLKLVVQANRY